MILVTLGTQKFQMNRLVQAADRLAIELDEEVFVQLGNSTYIPQHCKYKDFVDANTYREMIENCSVLVTHAGVGSIMTGINAKVPVVVVPRQNAFLEHVDNHQMDIAEAFALKGHVFNCENIEELPDLVKKAKSHEFSPYTQKGGKIEDIIDDFFNLFN